MRAGDGYRGWPERAPFDAILLDAPAPGSGEVFDWSLTEGAPLNRRLILAGGLTPENVAIGIAEVHPWGVDVSTGVETTGQPGRKDPAKIHQFVAAVRAADALIASTVTHVPCPT